MKKLTLLFAAFTVTGLLIVSCGGSTPECVAGEVQCLAMQVQTCSEDGTWGAAEDCDIGTCMNMGNGDQCMDMGDDDDASDDDDSASDDDDDSSK